MKFKYIGESIGATGLTNGKIYEILGEENGMYRVIDDSGEDYLYLKENPGSTYSSDKPSYWKRIEEPHSLTIPNKIKDVISFLSNAKAPIISQNASDE